MFLLIELLLENVKLYLELFLELLVNMLLDFINLCLALILLCLEFLMICIEQFHHGVYWRWSLLLFCCLKTWFWHFAQYKLEFPYFIYLFLKKLKLIFIKSVINNQSTNEQHYLFYWYSFIHSIKETYVSRIDQNKNLLT